jgi:hypothetical protein
MIGGRLLDFDLLAARRTAGTLVCPRLRGGRQET